MKAIELLAQELAPVYEKLPKPVEQAFAAGFRRANGIARAAIRQAIAQGSTLRDVLLCLERGECEVVDTDGIKL